MVFCDEYNKKALEIAQEFKTEMQGRIPQQLTLECKPNKAVLVIGMNPSFNISWITNIP
jgi:DNA-binding transcriptional regulator/RsmH inhibitor MraZ